MNKTDKLANDFKRQYTILVGQYQELDKEAGNYNRHGFDKVYSIIDELVKDSTDVGDKGDIEKPLAEGDVINEALKLSGFADDKEFVSDFKKYREIERQAREIQIQALEMQLHEIIKDSKSNAIDTITKDVWRFKSISFFAPKAFHGIIGNILEEDASTGKGFFSNITNIEIEDEDIDDLLMIDAYNMKCSFVPYLDELKLYKVHDTFLDANSTKCLFLMLKKDATFIKENTNAPSKVKNHIQNTLKTLDELPIWGLFFQILILQGLCRWFENINIKKGEYGFDEAKSLYKWLSKNLIEKEIWFCYLPYGQNDKEKLKPFCDYLYSTEIGQMVQNHLFKKNTTEKIENENKDIGDIVDKILNKGYFTVTERDKLINLFSGKKIKDKIPSPRAAPGIVELVHTLISEKKINIKFDKELIVSNFLARGKDIKPENVANILIGLSNFNSFDKLMSDDNS